MPQAAKKFTPHAASSASKPSLAEVAQKAQKKIFAVERSGVEGFVHAADRYNQLAADFVSMCSDNLEALAESGNIASRGAHGLNSEIAEICNRSFSEISAVTKDAIACRTMNDFTELHTKAMNKAITHYFDRVNKISSLLFDCCDEALEPINERAATASKQIRKILAV